MALAREFATGVNVVGGSIEFVDRNYGIVVPIELPVPPVTASAAELSLDIDLPATAIVLDGSITVTADAAGHTPIATVAQVRASSGDPAAASAQLVVDFGGMRTISAVSVGGHATIQSVSVWLGTKFDDAGLTPTPFGVDGLQFSEVQTERLQLTLSATVAPADAMADGTVIMTTPPADMELLVNGTRAWFRPGAAPTPFSEDVPVAPLLQAAVDAGDVPVKVTLKSRVAGRLGVTPEHTSFLNTHVVVFPGGTSADLEMSEEGPVTLPLPLPAAAANWQVRRVDAVVAGDVGPGRVVPALGPAASSDVLLGLDPDHAVVVRLPRAQVRRLAKLTALRIFVAAGPSGAEIGGTLRSDRDGDPGDPLPGATLGPVTVAAPVNSADDPVAAWVTLALTKPLAVSSPDRFVWASIQCSRGQLTWPLALGPTVTPAAAPAAAPPDQDDLNTSVRRQLPNGNYRPLSAPRGVATDSAVLRVAGEPPRDSPIFLMDGGIGGTASTTVFTPNPGGVTLKLGAEPAVTASTPGAFVDGALLLSFTSTSSGRLKIGPVIVAYSIPAGTP